VLADDIFLDAAANDRAEFAIGGGRSEGGEFAVGKIAKSRAEPKTEHGAQDEHVVGCAAGIDVVRADPQPEP